MNERTVLVIDDEFSVRDVIRRHLEDKGYKVFTAGDGEEGLKKAREIQPGLIILDMNMPKRGGLAFYNDIVVNKNRKLFPVLVLTERREFENLFKDVKADGFVPKPIDFQKLLKEVEGIFVRYAKPKSKTGAKSVLIVEDDDEALPPILFAFARDGFTVSCVKTEGDLAGRVSAEPLSLVIAKLSLGDVVYGLKKIPGLIAEETVVLLYEPTNADLNIEVVRKLCEKVGVTPGELVKTNNAYDLLRKAREVMG